MGGNGKGGSFSYLHPYACHGNAACTSNMVILTHAHYNPVKFSPARIFPLPPYHFGFGFHFFIKNLYYMKFGAAICA